jgi:hypothetical protein
MSCKVGGSNRINVLLGGYIMELKDMWSEFEKTGSIKAYLMYKNKEKMLYETSKELVEENIEVEE